MRYNRKLVLQEIKCNKRKGNPRELTRDEVKICFKILTCFNEEDVATPMSLLKERMQKYIPSITEVEIRQHILYIRREMNRFQNPTGRYFITANKNGYILTSITTELEAYHHNLTKRRNNIEAELLELELALANAER